MPIDPKIDQYLTQLDQALGPISIGDRSDIITDIKGHILESVARNPGQTLGEVLASLGPAEEVANRYLLERGLKPRRPSKSPLIKWLTIGFLGTFGLFLLFILVLVWKFSPVIKVDEENERVTILGGLIDIDANSSASVDLGDLRSVEGQRYAGDVDVTSAKVGEVRLAFVNGKFEVTGGKDATLSWECKAPAVEAGDFVAQVPGGVQLNVNGAKNLKCRITVPAGVKLTLEGTNGKVKFLAPNFPIDARITNGNVGFESDPTLKYKFEAKVTNGKVQGIRSSDDADAIPVSFVMTNGKIAAE